MEALYLLIPVSLLITALAIWVFLRMTGSGQFDDLDGPAHSILLDDDTPSQTSVSQQQQPYPPPQSPPLQPQPPQPPNRSAAARPAATPGETERGSGRHDTR
ncbi:MAG: cbb3-type cytochrome oxidase assembly protein CcoS [Burkholderiaceae bacterium]